MENADDSNTPSDQGNETAGEIVRARDVLPGVIHILPQSSRPIFPGQVTPLLMDSTPWEATIKAVHDSPHDVVGLLLVRTERVDDAIVGDFYAMGTACRIHRVMEDSGKLQVLVEGLQRFRVEQWTSKQPPFKRIDFGPERERVRS